MPHGWLSVGPTRSMLVGVAAVLVLPWVTVGRVDAKRAALKSAALMNGVKAIDLQLVQGRYHRSDRGHGDGCVNPRAIDRCGGAVLFGHQLDIGGGFGFGCG